MIQRFAVAGDDERLQMRPVRAKSRDHFITGHRRHEVIRDHQIDAVARSGQCQGFQAIMRDDNIEPDQRSSDEVGHQHVVVDDEDALHGAIVDVGEFEVKFWMQSRAGSGR